MRGEFATDAEVSRRAYQPGPEDLLPEAIDCDPGRQRMLGSKQPQCKAQPVPGEGGGHRGQDVRRVGLHLVAPLVVLAAIKNIGHRRLAPFLHHMRDGAPRPDGSLLLLQYAILRLELPGGRISGFQPPGQHGLRILLGTLLHRPGKQRQGTTRAREIGSLVRGDDCAVDPYIADANIIEPRRGVTLAHFQGNIGPDGTTQLIGCGLALLKFSIDVELDAGSP